MSRPSRAGPSGTFQYFEIALVHDGREWISDPSAPPAKRYPRPFVLVPRWHETGHDPATFGDRDRLASLSDAIDERQALGLQLGYGGVTSDM